MSKRFSKKTVVITGSASGFGRGIALAFGGEGANVVVADVQVEAGREVVREIVQSDGVASFQECDVTNGASVNAAAKAAIEVYGKIDVWINNAGVSHAFNALSSVPESEFDRVFAINVKSLYHSSRAVVPHFVERQSGCFINIGSVSANRPRPGIAWYAASKSALITASRGMALELAPNGIRVNVINPVAGDTPFLNAHGEDSPQLREKFVSTIPLGRLAAPADIAQAALFLASDDASLITGVSLDVDGGRSI